MILLTGTCRATRQRIFAALAAVLLVPWLAGAAYAEDFEVRTANIRLADGAWALTARIDYRLTDEAIEALENGVMLTFRVEISVSRLRNWWPDPEVIAIQRDWQLAYDPLTKRYLVQYPDESEPTSHATLFGALNAIGRVQDLLVAEGSQLSEGETYDVAVRAVLDQQKLPGPLRLLEFWDGGFSLESDWYEWTMST